jgi:hypothetical protein
MIEFLAGGVLAYLWFRASRRPPRYVFRPHEERYRPPPIVFGLERAEYVPRYPTGHAPESVTFDAPTACALIECSCGRRLAVTCADLARERDTIRGVERAIWEHASAERAKDLVHAEAC